MASQIFRLVMRTGPNPGKAFEFDQSIITIGRDVTNTIVINDAEISRKHARILSQAGGFVIEDTGSTNGTYVNGQRLMGPHLLRAGELVVLGENVSLVYETFQYDPDATVAVTPEQYPGAAYPPAYAQPAAYPPPMETGVPPAPAAPRQTAPLPYSYSGQVPSGPAEEFEEVEEKPRNRRTLIIVSCGCLVILLCLLVGAGIVFDYLNLYCTGPFRYIFPCQ